MNSRRAVSGAARAAGVVIRQNRWRSAATLTICGIGTAGVIVAGAIGNAQVVEMQRRLDAVGGRLIVVSPNTVTPYPGRPRQLEHFISLEPTDIESIRSEIASVDAIVPVAARDSTVRLGNNAARVRLIGTVAEYAQVRRFTPARGRFLANEDHSERVVVLGDAVSRALHPQGVRPGDVVWLGGQPYETVGILQPLGVNFAGEDEDRQVFIPLETYRHRVANRLWLSHLYLQVNADADSADTAREVVRVLRARHDRFDGQVDDVIARDMAEAAVQQSSLSATAVWIVSLTSGLLLVLGVVGIATLMVQTVRQRRGEIGLRRAVGATPLDVAVQLFLEAMALAGAGVIGGVVVGMTGALAGQALWGTVLTVDSSILLLTVVMSLAVSGIACLVPALMAARVEPAAALRL
jgi:putative ABC transport system permease protein